jgi:hypothetical protein
MVSDNEWEDIEDPGPSGDQKKVGPTSSDAIDELTLKGQSSRSEGSRGRVEMLSDVSSYSPSLSFADTDPGKKQTESTPLRDKSTEPRSRRLWRADLRGKLEVDLVQQHSCQPLSTL